jgi:hypothetical protein
LVGKNAIGETVPTSTGDGSLLKKCRALMITSNDLIPLLVNAETSRKLQAEVE